jgi:hypothetical protein
MKRKATMTTTIDNKAVILADLWLNYRDDEEFKDFIEYNDLGLPLAYLLNNKIVSRNNLTDNFINETFDLLLEALEIVEDTGFESLDELFDTVA